MEKSKITKDSNKRANGDNSVKYKQSDNVKYKQSEQEVYIRHRINGALEYKVDSTFLHFSSYERKKVNKKLLESDDFKKISKYFTVERS